MINLKENGLYLFINTKLKNTMKKTVLSLMVVLIFANSYSQNALWSKITNQETQKVAKMERAAFPDKFKLYSLDLSEMKTQLKNVPLDSQTSKSNMIMAFPDADGNFNNYTIYEAPVMEPELEAKFPGIKSYVGKGIEDPTATIRFSITIFGLHTMTLSGKTGTSFIDTYTKDLNSYIVYKKADVLPTRNFQCLVTNTTPLALDNQQNTLPETQKASDSKFRVFRLAMACTIEYAAFHVNAAGLNAGTLTQKKAAVLSAMVVTMTRVNGVYERDLSMRLNLVGTNDLVIFIDADNFTNDDANALISESQSQISSIIGSANFDIGHTVSTGGGGLAGPSPCTTNSKANGITGSPSPVGDPYDIDYVAHEMGHQFGANHTFNGDSGNCGGGNRNGSTAAEPGSGTTIMAYAGICGGQNVQSNSDAHFHAVSIVEINALIAGSANCAVTTSNGNTPPAVNAGLDYTIPKGTAFVLKGNATDVNSDALTYCWEQTDVEISVQPPLQTSTTGPNFRSLPPTASPNRYFPALDKIIAGNLAPRWEVIPTVARAMNFALTVRDNRSPNGGQTSRDNMLVTVGAAGPFNVTSQTTNVTWVQNTSQNITWNVAGTTAAPYNVANVNILFSSDNGLTFTTLLANTPNDGSQAITVPNITAPYCKIMVEAIGNIFFAENVANIAIGYTITATTTCNTYTSNPNAIIVEQNPLAYQNFTLNVPTGGVISDVNVSTNITSHRVAQLYVRVNHPDNSSVALFFGDDYGCNNSTTALNTTFDDAGGTFVCTGAGAGNTYKPAGELSTLNGKDAAGNWTFRVADIVAGIDGILNSFSLNICTTNTVVTLGTNQNFELADFVLFPNPNKGNFTVQFNSDTNKEVNISVNDLSGRLIFSNKYNNPGLFSEKLHLENLQTGVYLVTVQDGTKKIVKRIIIE